MGLKPSKPPLPALVSTLAASASASAAPKTWTLNRFLILTGPVPMWMAVAIFGNFQPEAFLGEEAVLLIPGLLAILLIVFFPRPWAHLVAGILGSLHPLLVLFVFGTAEGLVVRTSEPGGFALGLLPLMSLLMALPAGIMGFVQGRKRRPQIRLRGGWGTRQGIFTLLVSGLSVGTFAATAMSPAIPSAAGFDFGAGETVTVTQEGFEFLPATLTVAKSNITQITVENKDGAYHTFTYVRDGQTYNHPTPAGTTTSFLVKFDAAGAYQFWCEPHSSGTPGSKTGMVGTLTVA